MRSRGSNREGLTRAIGVSNFYPDRLVDLIEHNEITPAVTQIECHPFFQRVDYQELLREQGTQIESWGPFAEGRNNLFSDPTLAAIGAAHSKSVAQVVLRWLIQRDVVVIPKSVRPERMSGERRHLRLRADGRDAADRGLDTGASLFIDHHDPQVARQLRIVPDPLTEEAHIQITGATSQTVRASRQPRRPPEI